jgi:hypothetical protein
MHMTNANKVKGDAFERALREYLRECDAVVDRTRAGYARDAGDLHVGRDGTLPRAILQAKNVRAWRLPEWLAEAEEQRREAGAVHGAVVVKRRGMADPAQQYVVMTMADWALLASWAGLTRGGPALDPVSEARRVAESDAWIGRSDDQAG